MFLRREINKNRRDKLDSLESELAALREEVGALRNEVEALRDEVRAEKEARETYVNEDGERVPMSQVLNEYLYGKETADQ